jgi:hypothetical protein
MFARHSKYSDGFSIDEAAELSTMLASGFLILKVLNEFGEHLICLDIRKGARAARPEKLVFAEYLACMDIDKDNIYDAAYGDEAVDVVGRPNRRITKVKKLQPVEFRWNRVLGLYVKDSKFG